MRRAGSWNQGIDDWGVGEEGDRMVLLDDDVYNQTKDMLLGRAKPGPLLVEFSDWFMQTCSGRMLNFQFSKLPGPGESRYRLYVILANRGDHRRIFAGYEGQIADQFRRLALKHRFADESLLEHLFVAYNDFPQEAQTEANWKATPQLKAWALARYPAVVWTVQAAFSTSVVFYYSDSDIAASEASGVSRALTNEYYALLKRHDELHAFADGDMHLRFDSKENVDKNYAGSLFSYFQ